MDGDTEERAEIVSLLSAIYGGAEAARILEEVRKLNPQAAADRLQWYAAGKPPNHEDGVVWPNVPQKRTT